MYLAHRSGEVVSKEELLEAVWPGVYVSDGAIRRTISHLRRALDDDPQAPRYIETIPKTGYRLVATVRPAATGRPTVEDAVLGYPLDRSASAIDLDAAAAPEDRLVSLVDRLLFGTTPGDSGEESPDGGKPEGGSGGIWLIVVIVVALGLVLLLVFSHAGQLQG